MGKNLTTEEFIKRAKKVHGNRYDYSKTEYKNGREKIKIFCKKHDNYFFQSPETHLNGSGCQKCANERIAKAVSNRQRMSQEEFIQKSIKAHGNRYDYSKVRYIDGRIKTTIICKKHGKFGQCPSEHIRGEGCPHCGGKIKSNTKEFIKKAKKIHGNKYKYDKVKYISCKVKVIIVCKKHGKFKQKPANHLSGQGCKKCAGDIISKKMTKTTDCFISEAKKIHNNRYRYDKVIYINSIIKVKIICLKHGIFEQVANAHLMGQGCPDCKLKSQFILKNIIKKYFKGWIIKTHKKIWHTYKKYNHKRYCDFWLEKNSIKLMIEHDGRQHFTTVQFGGISIKRAQKKFKNQQKIDKLDSQFCKENNIILHRVKYNEDKEKSIIEFKEKLIKNYEIK